MKIPTVDNYSSGYKQLQLQNSDKPTVKSNVSKNIQNNNKSSHDIISPPTNIHKILRKAAGSKDPTLLPALLSTHSPPITLADLEETIPDGKNALHMACWTGNLSNISRLLEREGCNIDSISTGLHSYGKTPIFFAITRDREDVVEYLLNRGANVRIVNNKGQSVYSLGMSHLPKEIMERIKLLEVEQDKIQLRQCSSNGWLDYSKSHSDGCIYGDLDLRFINRALTKDDVVKDGVVNPSTKQSRKGNFARNNPQAVHNASAGKMNDDANEANNIGEKKKKKQTLKKKQQQCISPILTKEEEAHLDKSWSQVQSALTNCNSWDAFSSLLSVVQFWDGKEVQSPWITECATQLQLLVNLERILCEISLRIVDGEASGIISSEQTDEDKNCRDRIHSALSEATIFCGSGDRHASLVKRILTKSIEKQNAAETDLTQQEEELILKFWNDVEIAIKNGNSEQAFISLIQIVIIWDEKNCPWMQSAALQLHTMLETISLCTSGKIVDAAMKDMLGYCENNNRHASLLKKLLTKSVDSQSDEIDSGNKVTPANKNTSSKKKNSTKTRNLPKHYLTIMNSLRKELTENGDVASWNMLLNPYSQSKIDHHHLSLANPPKLIDSSSGLKILQSKLCSTISSRSGIDAPVINDKIQFERIVSFDSEWCTSDNGTTELATIQFSIFEDGIPLAWVVDLQPNGAVCTYNDDISNAYSTMTCSMLRWLFLESDAYLLGFAHQHDLHMISSYIGEEIPVTNPRFLDLQLIAANKMADGSGNSSLPGLKSCCSYFIDASTRSRERNDCKMDVQPNWSTWELSKEEQCSDWSKRPLSTGQLEYAGLDAAVLLVLLAEIVRI